MPNDKDLSDIAKALMHGVNGFSIEHNDFVQVVTTDHRTLQQSAFRLFYACIVEWADLYKTGRYDLRNEATCKACFEIMELFEQRKLYIPMV